MILLSTYARSVETDDNDITNLYNKTVLMITSKRFDDLSKMFHYPPSYKTTALDKDRCNVKNSIADLFDYFGTPKKLKELRKNSFYYTIGGGGGDLSYWTKHPKSITINKEAMFSKRGIGVLTVEISLINNATELKTVKVGFYANDTDAKTKMSHALEFVNGRRKERDAKGICVVK